MVAINACYTKKLERYYQPKFGYLLKSNLLKSPFDKYNKRLLSREIRFKNVLQNYYLHTKNVLTSQKYFENVLLHMIFDWNFMQLLPIIVAKIPVYKLSCTRY